MYFKHVSKHLREVALAVLPQTSMSDIDSDIESEVSEDAPKPEDPETQQRRTAVEEGLLGLEPSMENIKACQFSSRIMIRFPDCNRELALRLGRACWETWKICEALRHENNQEIEGIEQKEDKTDSAEGAKGSIKPSSIDSPRVLLSYKGWDGQNIGVALVPQPEGEGERNCFKCPACGKKIDYCQRAEWR